MPAASATRPHQPVKGVDLPDEMALPKAANRRVARHHSDRVVVLRNQGGFRADARRSRGSFTAGMPATNHNHVERHVFVHL